MSIQRNTDWRQKKVSLMFPHIHVVEDQDNEKMPTDLLLPSAIDRCKSVGSNARKVSEILSGPDGNILRAIQDGMDKANKMAISRAACVQRWTILPLDLSVPTGEIGPTLKVKRFYINHKYNHAIERLYR